MGIVFIKNRIKKDKVIIIFLTIIILAGILLLNSINILSRYPSYIKSICDINNTYSINLNYYDNQKGIEESVVAKAMMTSDEDKLDKLIELKEMIFKLDSEKYRFLEMPVLDEVTKNGQIIDIAYINNKTAVPNNNLKNEGDTLVSNKLSGIYKVNNNYRLNYENKINVKGVLSKNDILLKDIFDEKKYTDNFLLIRKENISKEVLRKNTFDILKGMMVVVNEENIEDLKKEILKIDNKISSVQLRPVRNIIYENYTSKNTFNILMISSYTIIIGSLILISMIIVNYINMKKRKREFMILLTIGYSYKTIILNTMLEEGILVFLSLVISVVIQKISYLITKIEWIDVSTKVWGGIIALLIIFNVILCIAIYIWFYKNRKNVVVRGE